jgi:hypothetical protein
MNQPTNTPPAASASDRAADLMIAILDDAERVSYDLLRFGLNHREEKTARIILHHSLASGIRQVCIPRLDTFGIQGGMNKSAVSVALRNLERMHIILVEETADGPRYEINTNAEEWRCRPMSTSDEARRGRDEVRSVNPLAQRRIHRANPASTYQI